MRTIEEIIQRKGQYLRCKDIISVVCHIENERTEKMKALIADYESEPTPALTKEETEAVIDSMIQMRREVLPLQSRVAALNRTIETWRLDHRRLLLENTQLRDMLTDALKDKGGAQ